MIVTATANTKRDLFISLLLAYRSFGFHPKTQAFYTTAGPLLASFAGSGIPRQQVRADLFKKP
jgi:hypothetical protein